MTQASLVSKCLDIGEGARWVSGRVLARHWRDRRNQVGLGLRIPEMRWPLQMLAHRTAREALKVQQFQ